MSLTTSTSIMSLDEHLHAPCSPPSGPTLSTLSLSLPPKVLRFRSRRIKNKDDIQRPWLEEKPDPREKCAWIFPLCGMIVGFIMTGFMCYLGLSKVPHHEYCPVLMEDFKSGVLDPKVWTQEVQVGGFGNGEFEQTTNTGENAFIKNGQLVLKPTLQDPALVENNNVLNLIDNGCTGTSWWDCVASTNTTNGTIVNPVKSARLTTLGSAHIKYGRVEVEVRVPRGDWLWPAVWMLPVNNTYGPWPASGEIDLLETRGNNKSYPAGGSNKISSTLHWGANKDVDRYLMTTGGASVLHSTFDQGFHTIGLEWSEKYLFTYLDNRLNQVLYVGFQQSFWHRGWFPATDMSGTQLIDPWSQTGKDSTPFDQDFYLVLSLAVGGTNSYFPDGNGKPWVNESPTAMKQFWDAQDEWYPTWKESGEMLVKSVKMWQEKGYNGCK